MLSKVRKTKFFFKKVSKRTIQKQNNQTATLRDKEYLD